MMFDVFFGRANNGGEGVSRRDFLRVGGLSAVGLTLANTLQAQTTPATTPHGARAHSVILVYLGGGLSHHDSFDLKPDAPQEIRGIYRPIQTNVPGLQIGNLLPHMARQMDKVCLI